MNVYIAGPMRGLSVRQWKRNFAVAEEYLIKRLNFESSCIHNPARMAHNKDWDKDTPIQVIIRNDLDAVQRCTHMYMLEGWEFSIGARAEHAVAMWLGLRILYQ